MISRCGVCDAAHVRQRVSCWFDSRSIKASRCHANAHLCIWVISVFRLGAGRRAPRANGSAAQLPCCAAIGRRGGGRGGACEELSSLSPRRSSGHLEQPFPPNPPASGTDTPLPAPSRGPACPPPRSEHGTGPGAVTALSCWTCLEAAELCGDGSVSAGKNREILRPRRRMDRTEPTSDRF